MVATHDREVFNVQPCIEREADSLTPEQLKLHAKEVEEACLSELRKWVNLGALKIRNRVGSPNIMDSRRVIRFKRMPDGTLIIKARLCIRGFKDGQIDVRHVRGNGIQIWSASCEHHRCDQEMATMVIGCQPSLLERPNL